MLAHADLGAEHILERDGTLTRIIDWSDAAFTDPRWTSRACIATSSRASCRTCSTPTARCRTRWRGSSCSRAARRWSGRGLGFAVLHIADTKNVIAPEHLEQRLRASGFDDIAITAQRDHFGFRARRAGD